MSGPIVVVLKRVQRRKNNVHFVTCRQQISESLAQSGAKTTGTGFFYSPLSAEIGGKQLTSEPSSHALDALPYAGHTRGMKRYKVAAAAFLLSFVLAFSLGTASAGSSVSGWGYYGPQSGISYRNRNAINVFSGAMNANATVEVTSGGPAPQFWTGINVRMYSLVDGTNYVCYSTGWGYNQVSTNGWTKFTGTVYNCNIPSVMTAKSQTRAWNGYGYNTYTTFVTTPGQNWPL